MPSSIASLVPEPMEKCAVALASPMSTTLSATHRSQRMVGKLRQIERLVISAVARELLGEQTLDEARRRGLVERGETGACERVADRSR